MEINQEDRNLGMLAHGLVAFAGLSACARGLGGIGIFSPIASIMLYFIWKSKKSPFVVRHLKQAAGLQMVHFVLTTLFGRITSTMAIPTIGGGGIGGAMAITGLLTTFGLLISIASLILGVLGLLEAQKGKEYLYPAVGQWIDNLKI